MQWRAQGLRGGRGGGGSGRRGVSIKKRRGGRGDGTACERGGVLYQTGEGERHGAPAKDPTQLGLSGVRWGAQLGGRPPFGMGRWVRSWKWNRDAAVHQPGGPIWGPRRPSRRATRQSYPIGSAQAANPRDPFAHAHQAASPPRARRRAAGGARRPVPPAHPPRAGTRPAGAPGLCPLARLRATAPRRPDDARFGACGAVPHPPPPRPRGWRHSDNRRGLGHIGSSGTPVLPPAGRRLPSASPPADGRSGVASACCLYLRRPVPSLPPLGAVIGAHLRCTPEGPRGGNVAVRPCRVGLAPAVTTHH